MVARHSTPIEQGSPVPSEQQMKEAMQAYIDGFNRSDAEGVIALYAEDATVEDPVGKPVMQGKAKIAEFYRMSIATGARLKLAAPIRASHGNSAAMAFDVELNMPQGRMLIRVIDVMTFDAAGKFSSMRAFWGPGDMQML
jgi:steroid delta-isomerase